MTETHCETALRHIQKVVTIASAANAPITVAEAMEQIVEALDLAGYGPVGGEPARSSRHEALLQ
jgi:hypothetical protein